MTSTEPPYYLHGDAPSTLGAACSGFYLLQHQVDGVVSDPANSAYFKFNDVWQRLYFDGNTIFWHKTEMPEEPVNDQFSSMLVLVNLNEMKGVVGSTLDTIRYWGSEVEVGTRLQFASGVELVFTHHGQRDTSFVAVNNFVAPFDRFMPRDKATAVSSTIDVVEDLMELTKIAPNWPNALLWFLCQNLNKFTPWHFIQNPTEYEFAANAFRREDVNKGEVFVFARRQDRDDFAGLEILNGKVTDKVIYFHPVFASSFPNSTAARTWNIVCDVYEDVFEFLANRVVPDMKDWASDEIASDL